MALFISIIVSCNVNVFPFTSSDNNPAIFWNFGSSIPFSANSFLVAVIVSAKIQIQKIILS